MPTYLEAYRAARTPSRQHTPDLSPGPAEAPSANQHATHTPVHASAEPDVTPSSPKYASKAGANKSKTATEPKKSTSANVTPTKKTPVTAPLKTPSKPKLDVPKQKGLYDTKNVRTKIAKWQALDEADDSGNVGDQDVPITVDPVIEDGPVRLEEAVEKALRSKPEAKPPNSKGIPGKAIDQVPEAAEAFKIITPKKRLVSDEHWKKDRSSPQSRHSPVVEEMVRRIVADKGIYVAPGGKTAEGWVRKRQSPVKKQAPVQDTAMPMGAPSKNKIGTWASNVDDPPSGNELGVDDVSPNIMRARRIKPALSPAKKSNPQHHEGQTTTDQYRKVSTTKNESSANQHASDSHNSAEAPDAPVNPMMARMQAWIMQTDDPFIEDIGADDADSISSSSRQGRDSGMAPRTTHVRDRAHRSERHHRKRSDEARATSPSRTDSDLHRSPDLGVKHTQARRGCDSPSANSNTANSVSVQPGWQITGRSTTSSDDQGMVLHSGPAIEPQRLSDNTSKQLQLKESTSRPAMKRKTTSHADLMSVLSYAGEDTSDRPSKSRRGRPHETRSEDVLAVFRSDEMQYGKDLKTLVDGVVPVLLSYCMSGSRKTTSRSNTRAITNLQGAKDCVMQLGVALERLQALHGSSISDSRQLMAWARRAVDVYAGYIRAWRLGFQGIVIDLAPGDGGPRQGTIGTADQGHEAQSGSERADVTFLLKRPIARLKYLHHLAQSLQGLDPSKDADDLISNYQLLIDSARSKQDQEKARIEDEAAAAIDNTRVRDPLSLAPLPSSKTRSDLGVRARDLFDLHLQHSSGQKIDCRVSLYLRDDGEVRNRQSDVLVCQLENSTKWLLFPPLELSNLSARPGQSEMEIVVMLRGKRMDGSSWHELISLTANSARTADYWVQMLGSNPWPPSKPSRRPSAEDDAVSVAGTCLMSVAGEAVPMSEVEVPLGEQSVIAEARPSNPRIEAWMESNAHDGNGITERPHSPSSALFGPRSLPTDHASSLDSATVFEEKIDRKVRFAPVSNNYTARVKNNLKHIFSDLQASVTPAPKVETRRSREERRHEQYRSQSLPQYATRTLPGDESEYDEEDEDGLSEITPVPPLSPSKQGARVPPIPRSPPGPTLRRQLSTIMSESVVTDIKPNLSDGDQARSSPEVLTITPSAVETTPSSPTMPLSRQRYRHARCSTSPSAHSPVRQSSPVPVREISTQPPTTGPRSPTVPQLKPSTPRSNARRRSSSPLKYEYEPSVDSDASSAIEELHSDDEGSVSSVSSLEAPMPQVAPEYGSTKQFPMRSRPSSTYSPTEAKTLGPSQSASQAPFRTVPREATDRNAERLIASIFSWSNKGSWESLHPDECSIIVSPGLIEAYKLTASHSVPIDPRTGELLPSGTEDERPLLAVELTPLVPLRQGTAIDISIRSPPTSNSLIRTGNNIMFRSRSGAECDALYQLINQARINNPTYIALQNARPKLGSGWGNFMDRQASQRESKSWWQLGSRKSSYRASSHRGKTASVAETRSSAASGFSASSALKRFSGTAKAFNAAKSIATSGGGLSNQNSRSTWTSSSGGSGSGYVAPGRAPDPTMGSPAGVTDRKIRLYEREVASKWKDMGRARLTILHPPRPASTAAMISPTGHLRTEKRVLVTGKTKGEMLLDVTLGETAFERVARTGIAVKFGEEYKNVKDRGGVVGGRNRVYMIQMKSEAEAAYIFSLVGRLRY